jgi:large subunit ribosomal protein L10
MAALPCAKPLFCCKNLEERRNKRLAITRERKEELVSLYGELLGQATGVVFADYKNISVAQVAQMRAKLRDVQGTYMITKNTLFKIALQNAGWPVPDDVLAGPTGVVFGAANFPQVAKVALGFVKDYEGFFTIKGGVMTGSLLNPKQVETVSRLPSLDELRSQLAGLISQPAAGLVSVINAGVAAMPQVLQAYVSKNEAA